MKKKLGLVLLFLAMALLAFPATVFAGGTVAAVCVKYVEVNSYGYASTVDTYPQNLTQTIQGPDASGKTKRNYRYEEFHYELGVDGTLYHPAGLYYVTAYDLPDGYELDEVAASLSDYPMSVTVTQADLDEYIVFDATEGAGTKCYDIEIPVKKIGTESALLKTPDVPSVRDNSINGYLYFDTSNSNETLEIQYSTSESGPYTTLEASSGTIVFENYDELKNGTTYYFRAKAIKTVGTRTLESAYTTPLKVKVKKALWLSSVKPTLKVTKWKSGKTRAVTCTTYKYKYKVYTTFYYSTSKNGTYKKLCTQSASWKKLTKLSKLKKGKTWYLKARYYVKLSDGTTAYSSYSKVVKIKR